MRGAERLRATYEFKPVDHLVRREFSIWPEAIEKWQKEGMPLNYNENNLFNFDPPGNIQTGVPLGGCEPPLFPPYENKVIKDLGHYEIIQDNVGRLLKVFKGKRHGFMPTYLKHPVNNRKGWEEDVKPRLDFDTPERWINFDENINKAVAARDKEGLMITQPIIGGYMYLRALIGPEDVLYAFYDMPDLIHDMMKQWASLNDASLEKIQKKIELDELCLDEDICYKSGLLISPEMVKKFLLPYYQEVIGKARKRQERKLYFQVDTDGYAPAAIPLYLQLGMDVMSPFEVASGCDVTKIGKDYPKLVIAGGIDKRILAMGKEAIEEHLQHIIPSMLKRGGYIPTCDHGVPDDVSFKSYIY